VRPLSPGNLNPVRRPAFMVPGLGVRAPAKHTLRVCIAVFASGSAPPALLPGDFTRSTDLTGDVGPGPRVWPLTSQAVFVFSLRRRMFRSVPRGEGECMTPLRAGAEDGQFCALDLFKSSVSPVGANEVSCQARPALSSFGIFVPRPPWLHFW
jgi:hypothetical protein